MPFKLGEIFVEMGLKGSGRVQTNLKGVEQTARRADRAMSRSQKGAKRLGFAFGQAGFAIQDFIQVASMPGMGMMGGLRASTNNLQQMAFLMKGPVIGAISGVAIGLGTALIPALLKTADGAKKAREELEQFLLASQRAGQMATAGGLGMFPTSRQAQRAAQATGQQITELSARINFLQEKELEIRGPGRRFQTITGGAFIENEVEQLQAIRKEYLKLQTEVEFLETLQTRQAQKATQARKREEEALAKRRRGQELGGFLEPLFGIGGRFAGAAGGLAGQLPQPMGFFDRLRMLGANLASIHRATNQDLSAQASGPPQRRLRGGFVGIEQLARSIQQAALESEPAKQTAKNTKVSADAIKQELPKVVDGLGKVVQAVNTLNGLGLI